MVFIVNLKVYVFEHNTLVPVVCNKDTNFSEDVSDNTGINVHGADLRFQLRILGLTLHLGSNQVIPSDVEG